MSKMIAVIGANMIFIFFAIPQNSRFSAYAPVEAYEVRQGILMMPRYSTDGRLCDIGIERRHYSPEKIRLESTLSRQEIDQILEKIVPGTERGPKSQQVGGELILQSGSSLTTTIDFENVFIQIVSRRMPTSDASTTRIEDVVASVHWKNRECK